ncbi:arginine decarboxylase, pyruvoyl-dependent [Candidatus Woesearchaeota archaeon]|nr:arginine decarboxylase, pyruvoyl-dependent [Candidatus Woesearchaeota archaeon]
MIPQKVFFTKGVGRHKDKLQSFELALRNAGIAQLNLVNVSSIFPPGCRIISREKGAAELKPGQITFVVMARAETNEPNRLVSSSIGLAIPPEGENYGYLSEHHAFGMTEKKAGEYAEDLAASMLASTLGIEFDPDKAYDERKEIYKMSEKIVRTSSISQSALGDKNGLWTTVLAAAVFIPPNGKAIGGEISPKTIPEQKSEEPAAMPQ